MSFEDIIKTLGSGLGQFGWNDLLDIAILTVLIYKLIVWTKDTRAYEVLKGVGFLIVASAAAQFLSLYTLSWLLDSILQSGTIIIVIFILFTPEIRRVLERLGRSGKAIGKLISEAGNMGVEDLIDDLHKTILRLSRRRVGALIVFEQKTGLGDIISTGTAIEGLVSGALIENIFEPNTPLHDGGLLPAPLRGDGHLPGAGHPASGGPGRVHRVRLSRAGGLRGDGRHLHGPRRQAGPVPGQRGAEAPAGEHLPEEGHRQPFHRQEPESQEGG